MKHAEKTMEESCHKLIDRDTAAVEAFLNDPSTSIEEIRQMIKLKSYGEHERIINELKKGYRSADNVISGMFMKNMDQSPANVARKYIFVTKIPNTFGNRAKYQKLARKIKRRLTERVNLARRRKGLPPLPSNKIRFAKDGKCIDVPPFTEPDANGTSLENDHENEFNRKTPELLYREKESRFTYEDFAKLIAPFEAEANRQKLLKPIYTLVNLLLTNGNYASILPMVMYDNESIEVQNYPDFVNIFNQFSVTDHTYYVLKKSIELVIAEDRKYMAPMIIAVALAHDLGKCPGIIEKSAMTDKDHAVISSDEFQKHIYGIMIHEVTVNAVMAVKYHHITESPDNSLYEILKRADIAARTHEIMIRDRFVKDYPWQKWFNLDELLELIKPHVNRPRTNVAWDAISHADTVYCTREALIRHAIALAKTKKTIYYDLYRKSEWPGIQKRIFDTIKDAEMLGDDRISSKFAGASYLITVKPPEKPFLQFMRFLIPIKTEAFGVRPRYFHNREEGFTLYIESISKTIKG